MQTLDLAIERAFRLTEKASFQFRAEAFNALNKTNLGTPQPLCQHTHSSARSQWR